jgi:superfamily II DNA or RNA helicase
MGKNTIPSKKTHTPSFLLTDTYKDSICEIAYIGKKGYTIPKTNLQKEDLEFLQKDLFVKPEIFGNYTNDDSTSFPVYRENDKKIYIPRFYGINRYGKPLNNELSSGDDIQLEFTKTLRDYQTNIVNIYIDSVNVPISISKNTQLGSGGILEVPCGKGKTVMALKIISMLSKKTLVIVHKEFLMNQWIDRIAEFLPGARIGKIQGTTFDIENKDIVIGMIQTMYDRSYSADTFSSFGLTIIDEVHRIGSEQFSKTLFKTITPYMLGISATLERKDKLTKILHMFIGEKVYGESRQADDQVCVHSIKYISKDSEFNETELDFRGKPKYSTMITKLCKYGPRSDFIIRVLNDMINEYPSSQIMVLCHNRSLLTYLFECIQHKNFATTGYYVGGMKQKDLQETETKQIVLATYAMAAEALDIKTLSILFMITPKTDITQSVGRILRVKHEHPIVVDIVDNHDLFQNQWNSRKRFYKKCNYKIIGSDSIQYSGETTNWKTIYEPNDKNKGDDEDKPLPPKCLIDTSIFANLKED